MEHFLRKNGHRPQQPMKRDGEMKPPLPLSGESPGMTPSRTGSTYLD